MKKTLLIFIFWTLFIQTAFGQYGKVNVTEPPFIINLGGEYATLGSQRSRIIFGGQQFHFYLSDEYGAVSKRKWKLPDYTAVDSAYAIANLPSGWAYTAPACLLEDGYLVGTWDVTGDELKVREFDGKFWLTQVVSSNPDAFAVRGGNMYARSDVSIENTIEPNCLSLIPESGLGGLYEPDSFTVPSGFELYLSESGTKIYTSGTPPTPVGDDESFATPVADLSYATDGSIASTRQSLSVTSNGSTRTLIDSQWGAGFCSGCGTRRVYIGASEASVAASRTLSGLDVSAIAGFDLAPITVYGSGTSTDDYSQSVVHVKADASKQRRTFIDGNYTYRWMIEDYEFSSGVYPSYQDYFPDFDLPAGKLGMTEYEFEPQHPYYPENNKGWTHTKTNPTQYAHTVIYDQWATNVGLPAAYSVSDSMRNVAFDNISESAFISSFYNHVISQSSKGVVMLNFEVFVGVDKNKQKLKNIFNTWVNSNPHAMLSFWTEKGGINTNRIQWEAETDINRIAPDINWTGDQSSWYASRVNTGANTGASIFKGNYSFVTDYADILYVNDLYQTSFNNTGWIHEAIGNTIMNRKFYPTKKILWMDFPFVELQVDIGIDNVAYVEQVSAVDGLVYKLKKKPLVDPADMWSRALYAYAFADGMDIWADNYPRTDDPYWYGSGNGHSKDQYNNTLSSDRYKEYNDGRNGGRAIGRSLKGLDWHVAAAYAVSQNADIIESNTEWEILEYSMDGGATYRTGDQGTLFANSSVNSELIPMYKEKSDGSAGLILLYNPSQDAVSEVTYKVKIDGVVHDVFQVGRYASIIRVAL